MPFADKGAPVAGGAERLGERDRGLIEREDRDVAPSVGTGEFGHADAVGVTSREQRRARGRAHGRGGAEMRELHALLRESIQMRRVDPRSIVAQIRPTQIVDEDDDEIRGAFSGDRRRPQRRAHKNTTKQ